MRGIDKAHCAGWVKRQRLLIDWKPVLPDAMLLSSFNPLFAFSSLMLEQNGFSQQELALTKVFNNNPANQIIDRIGIIV